MATTSNNNSNRRLSTSSSAKRTSSENNNLGKTLASGVPPQHAAKKRPALSNITNRHGGGGPRTSLSESSKIVPCTSKVVTIKKGSSATTTNTGFKNAAKSTKPRQATTVKSVSLPRSDVAIRSVTAPPAPWGMDVSPVESDGQSASMDESMSTCDSLKSPEIEYLDNNEMRSVDSIERKTSSKLCISDHIAASGNLCKGNLIAEIESSNQIVDIDDDPMDPQLCATIACDIYKHLRASEEKKRPSTDFMERVQDNINSSMRAILIDWLVEVAEEYRLVPDTLYLTVNYIDRYLSGNLMDRQRLQLLGVACMMIASKYEEICAPQVEEFCYITDNTYFKEDVLKMESDVLNYLKFEMTAPTAKCFLRRFTRAAQGVNEGQSLQLECLANYVAELSLLEYNMLHYAPSLIAASSIFLAKYIFLPSKRPWNSTLQHYTLYKPSDLRECVMALHSLCCNNHSSSLPAIREKYSQHKYKFVAKKYCPPSIPPEFFQDISSS